MTGADSHCGLGQLQIVKTLEQSHRPSPRLRRRARLFNDLASHYLISAPMNSLRAHLRLWCRRLQRMIAALSAQIMMRHPPQFVVYERR
jgi:hypothetical protein